MRDKPYMEERQGDLGLRIWPDEDPESPRSWENTGFMCCWNSRYSLGDKHTYKAPRDADIPDEAEFNEEFTAKERKRWNLAYPKAGDNWGEFGNALALARIEKDLDSVYRLPLYLYDHSGITISTGSFSCPWDSGQVGWIFAPRAKVVEGWGWWKMTPARLERIRGCLEGEVEVYDQYIRGDVYGFETFRYSKCNKGCEHEEDMDSCWGFFGNLKESGMRENMSKEYWPLFDKIV